MRSKINRGLLIIIFAAATFASCKKKDSIASEADKLKDSVLLYTRDIYLWHNQIPANFNPRTYADPNEIMEAVRQYSIEPPNTPPVDRFSFAALKKDWDNVSSGISADFG